MTFGNMNLEKLIPVKRSCSKINSYLLDSEKLILIKRLFGKLDSEKSISVKSSFGKLDLVKCLNTGIPPPPPPHCILSTKNDASELCSICA